jgi:primosomal protein N' (replication factor Y)
MAQVAGRAGRGPKGGAVFIQTRLVGHHAVRCAVAHDVDGFVRQELADRTAPPYPPTVRLANIVMSGPDEMQTMTASQQGAEWLGRLLEREGGLGITIVGPAPCPILRIKSRWRWHVLLKAERSRDLMRVAGYFARRFAVPSGSGVRVIVDRDPMTLL